MADIQPLIGGAPPEDVVMELCNIADLFSHLTDITTNADCTAGCAGGTGVCPPNWYPGSADQCSPKCGRVYEVFCASPRPPSPSAGELNSGPPQGTSAATC